ncbi:MAG: hypothetical protein J5537_06770 [Lachnospiraceae bacterium]|nr:hypothetical protein [Lachnospiraceae bacterium]
MSSFFAILWLAANVTMVVFIIKTVKEKQPEHKKKKRKIWLICLGIAFVSLILVGVTNDSKNSDKQTSSSSDTEKISEVNEETQNVAAEIAEEVEKNEVEKAEVVQDVSDQDASTVDDSNTDSNENSSDTDEAQTVDNETMVKVLIAATDGILKENFGSDNYTISYDDNMVTINVWQEGVAMGAAGVKTGLVDRSEWDTMVDNMQYMSNSIYDAYKPYDVDVAINIVNDQNKENTLVTFLDGIKVYDALDE